MNQQKIWSYYQSEAAHIFKGSAFRLNYLTRFLRKNDIVLNVGIGGGIFERYALDKGVRVFSIDPDCASLQVHEFDGYNPVAGRLEALPFADGCFDVVVVSEVLEHLSQEAFGQALNEIHRVLAKEGKIIGTVPCEEDLSENIVICPKCEEVFHKVGHMQSFSCRSMNEMLANVFSNTQCYVRAFMAKEKVGLKERLVDVVRNVLVKHGVLTREKSIVFIAIK